MFSIKNLSGSPIVGGDYFGKGCSRFIYLHGLSVGDKLYIFLQQVTKLGFVASNQLVIN